MGPPRKRGRQTLDLAIKPQNRVGKMGTQN
jgi:hypothetical protein